MKNIAYDSYTKIWDMIIVEAAIYIWKQKSVAVCAFIDMSHKMFPRV